MASDKVLPKEIENDYSLPGRFEEANGPYFSVETPAPRPKNRGLYILGIAFVVVAIGFFSYYFINQDDIDSRLIQNTLVRDPEKKLVNEFDVGKFGSDHAHGAIAIFVNNQKVDFSHDRYQLASKYIHFENHNSYLIHKHATGVPLEMLFVSLGMKISQQCITLNYYSENKNSFCTEEENSLLFFVNGVPYTSNISNYVISHDDRILISYGDKKNLKQQMAYLESLEIFDVPKKIPKYPGDGIII